jgi:hypothetical protein
MKAVEGSGRQWVVGWNRPGHLPDTDPQVVPSWYMARTDLLNEMAQQVIAATDKIEERGASWDERDDAARLIGSYTEASASVRHVGKDQPFSLYFNGLVWWVADVPTATDGIT